MTQYYELISSETGDLVFKPVVIAPLNPQQVRLDVPWVGQNVGASDDWSNSDCGPAVVDMWLRFLGQDVTVNQVSQATGLPRGYKGTAYWDLVKAAKAFGLSLVRITHITADTLIMALNQNHPVIVLVHYASLPVRSDPNFTGGHWVLVTGYDDSHLIYHDPYWKDSRGRHIVCTITEFVKAMVDCVIDGNTPNQGLAVASG